MIEVIKIAITRTAPVKIIKVAGIPAKVIRIGTIINVAAAAPPSYTKTLSGYTDTILQAEHSLLSVRGLRVTKPTGELVEVAEKYNGTTVQIDSNILLDNHTLTIY